MIVHTPFPVLTFGFFWSGIVFYTLYVDLICSALFVPLIGIGYHELKSVIMMNYGNRLLLPEFNFSLSIAWSASKVYTILIKYIPYMVVPTTHCHKLYAHQLRKRWKSKTLRHPDNIRNIQSITNLLVVLTRLEISFSYIPSSIQHTLWFWHIPHSHTHIRMFSG